MTLIFTVYKGLWFTSELCSKHLWMPWSTNGKVEWTRLFFTLESSEKRTVLTLVCFVSLLLREPWGLQQWGIRQRRVWCPGARLRHWAGNTDQLRQTGNKLFPWLSTVQLYPQQLRDHTKFFFTAWSLLTLIPISLQWCDLLPWWSWNTPYHQMPATAWHAALLLLLWQYVVCRMSSKCKPAPRLNLKQPESTDGY